jgi:hypothetical protein
MEVVAPPKKELGVGVQKKGRRKKDWIVILQIGLLGL